jgi:DNA polymerase-3 subunit alpha
VDEIIRTRDEKGKFTDFADFVNKEEFRELYKTRVESLIKSGGIDSLGTNEAKLMQFFSKYIDFCHDESAHRHI